MESERRVKKLTGRQNRREKTRKTRTRVDGRCQIGLEEYGCEKMENRSFAQNRMGISHERSQGQN
jgi:hypothetical protein